MKRSLNKHFVTSFLIFFLVIQFYSIVEHAFAQTSPQTDVVIVTLEVNKEISISDGLAVTMAPPLGIAASQAIGSSVWTIITNGALGYTLSLKASTAPALVSGLNSFADYTEAVLDTPDVWSVAVGDKEFGYSAFGTDTNTAIWGTSASCGVAGVPAALQKYVKTKLTDRVIATRATVTPIAGIATTICFAAQQNGVFAPSGTYTATITGTAVTL